MKHKHHDVIVAWAADTSKVVQKFNLYKEQWEDLAGAPVWEPTLDYRIKPEPKPDVVCGMGVGYDVAKGAMTYMPFSDARTDNLRLTFDGETGELKAAEVLV